METVAIIIPIYKPTISFFEEQSLLQCFKVLTNYDIYLIHPVGIDLSYYRLLQKKSRLRFLEKGFDKHYFEGIGGYNNLMVSENFYKGFNTYEFLLIYQLDAYIFKDDINKWCNKKYSIIGAPIHETIFKILTKKYSDDFNKQINSSICYMNGGFSLRHIQTMIEILQNSKSKTELLLKNLWPEDIIINLLLAEGNMNLPHKSDALKFSFEAYPDEAYKLNSKRLPTGCHAWYRNDFGIHNNLFWFKHIIPFYYYKLQITELTLGIINKNSLRLKRFFNYIRK